MPEDFLLQAEKIVDIMFKRYGEQWDMKNIENLIKAVFGNTKNKNMGAFSYTSYKSIH